MTFSCKWGCGTLLDTDPSITTVTGRPIPLSGGIPHDYHLLPYFRRISSNAVSKQEIQKIEAWEKKQKQELEREREREKELYSQP